MFDIIIKQGKKESFIKLNGDKLEGFTALNGNIFPLTGKEVNTINLLKLSENKEYLGKDNEYDVYLDNNSGLKHYFKDGKEDIEATWEHNGEDALVYKGNNKKEQVKKIKLKKCILLINSMFFIAALTSSLFITNNSMAKDNENVVKNEVTKEDDITASKEIIDTIPLEPVTVSRIEKFLEENDKLTEEEKELVGNTKLLEDIIPYYENTNMIVLIPLKFDDLHVEYYYSEPEKEQNKNKDNNGYVDVESAFYSELIPNTLFVNTYFDTEDRHDDKAHEYIHLLQASHEYRYITEACAEIISSEYDEECVYSAYSNPVKNTKILMEIVGPLPIWKLNFSGDDTDLVNIIKANLEEEKADKLIGLLKEKPGKDQIENLDIDITSLLSQMYTNMYGEDMRNNPFIDCLLGNGKMYNRYYFNSDFIEKEAPYTKEIISTLPADYTFWYVYVFSSDYYFNPEIDIKDYIYNKDIDIVFMFSKNQLQFNDIKAITEDIFEKNEIKFYYHGEEFTKDNFDLSNYENIPFKLLGGINPEVQQEEKITYYPTIYELFPDQRIGEKEFSK